MLPVIVSAVSHLSKPSVVTIAQHSRANVYCMNCKLIAFCSLSTSIFACGGFVGPNDESSDDSSGASPQPDAAVGATGDAQKQAYFDAATTCVDLGCATGCSNGGACTAVTGISVGNDYTCAIVGGGAKCWGQNSGGDLGIGPTYDNPVPPSSVSGLSSGVTAISTGEQHACAIVSGGEVWCWGNNALGALGDGTNTSTGAPVNPIGLPVAIAVAAGGDYTCALGSEGDVACWGENGYGQLGNGSSSDSLIPVQVANLSSVTAIAAGAQHACALTSNGTVYCWGNNGNGELGDGTTTERYAPVVVVGLSLPATAITAGSKHTCALTSDGAVWCWGANVDGQLGNGTTTDSVAPTNVLGLLSGDTAIAAGANHTCALTSYGKVSCWGKKRENDGSGYLDSSMSVVPLSVDALGLGVTAISADIASCAVTATGVVACWGSNGVGELGDGTTTDSDIPVNVVGW